jgi:DNA topoisomerase-1
MAKNLVIVESPAKAKTIEGFLGKDFIVKSCYGHVRDLSEKGISIEIDKGFLPIYEISPDKKKIISELKKLADQSETVWLASDEDREGEAISWHLYESLKLQPEKTKRIVFNEITKKAILSAIENPRNIDLNLVNAQQARRVLDRLVGYEISPVLWKKVKPSLSAGRVQSVAVKLIVERERERNAFKSTSYFKVTGKFAESSKEFKAELAVKFDDEDKAGSFLKSCMGAQFKVDNIETKPAKRTPSAPFTTSTLQQEAGRKLGFTVQRTMQIAQRLYEEGFITYMRTDSVNLSDTAIQGAESVIVSHYGKEFHQVRKYATKSKGAQEAHEAIRPTYFEKLHISSDASMQKLYELIWKRTIASQMADALLEKTQIDIRAEGVSEKFVASGEVIKFEGFLKVYAEEKDEDPDESENTQNQNLPALKKGQSLTCNEITAVQRFTMPPARYTEAGLVKKLEDLGIGRPSTYAPTISTIQKRGYVEKKEIEGVKRNYSVITLKNNSIKKETKSEYTGAEKGKLSPTDIGILVTDFLSENFKQIMDYHFTAKVEKEFDDIAEGNLAWNKMIEEFYGPFHSSVEFTEKNAERARGKRELGKDPATGKSVYALVGRYGPMVQIGETEDKEKPQYATLKSNQSIETITLEEALSLFRFPLSLGDFEGKEIIVGEGRFGPYVKWGEQFISLPRGEDPLTVNISRAIEIIKEKQETDAPIASYQNKPVTKGKGRFGPFIKWDNLFINVPKTYNFDNLSQKEIEELISKKLEKQSNRFIKQWEDEKIALENGRWGPFIRFGKNMLKILPKEDKSKYTPEEIAALSLEEVKKMIETQMPEAFEKAPKKMATPKKKAAVKSAIKAKKK